MTLGLCTPTISPTQVSRSSGDLLTKKTSIYSVSVKLKTPQMNAGPDSLSKKRVPCRALAKVSITETRHRDFTFHL
jgi:hypothetical protein